MKEILIQATELEEKMIYNIMRNCITIMNQSGYSEARQIEIATWAEKWVATHEKLTQLIHNNPTVTKERKAS